MPQFYKARLCRKFTHERAAKTLGGTSQNKNQKQPDSYEHKSADQFINLFTCFLPHLTDVSELINIDFSTEFYDFLCFFLLEKVLGEPIFEAFVLIISEANSELSCYGVK